MVELDFGGVKENVITRDEFTVKQAQEVLKDEVVATLGYGIQGRAQSLNMRDNGIKIIMGQEKRDVHAPYYEAAVKDGWVPGKTLFSMKEAAQRGTIKQFLLTDSGQREMWPVGKATLTEGKAEDRVKAMGIAIGSGYLFPTTFEKEVYSDLTGERGVLMGALAGIMEAQYNTLREHR